MPFVLRRLNRRRPMKHSFGTIRTRESRKDSVGEEVVEDRHVGKTPACMVRYFPKTAFRFKIAK